MHTATPLNITAIDIIICQQMENCNKKDSSLREVIIKLKGLK